MKKFNLGHFICGVFAGLGCALYIAVLIEWLLNDYEAAAWVGTAKTFGLVSLVLACLTLVIVVLVDSKKQNKQEKKNNESELLEKYKSAKRK